MSLLSHWHHLVEDFNTSALDFYEAVELAVDECELPDVQCSRVIRREGAIGTPKREYLRVKSGRVAFDICAAPIGNSFFFSWWLSRVPGASPFWYLAMLFFGTGMLGLLVREMFGYGCSSLVMLSLFLPGGILLLLWSANQGWLPEEDIQATPFLGWLYRITFNPEAFYKLDSALMHQEVIRRVVNEVIADLLSDQGLRALSSQELEPMLQDFTR